MNWQQRMTSVYKSCEIALATMHGKETAIAPWADRILGAQIVLPSGLDTDQFGTFSGEVDRVGSMGEIAVRKAELAMELSGLDLAISSEGTYGPHPFLPFMPGGMELLVFIDRARQLTISESIIDDAPCFYHIQVSEIGQLSEFLMRIGFPEQGVIVRSDDASLSLHSIVKGISSSQLLEDAIRTVQSRSGTRHVLVQTDMRAQYNPTRMRIISKLAEKLCRRIMKRCPKCEQPGFGRITPREGRSCAECNTPTSLTNGHLITCDACFYSENVECEDRLQRADPRYCPVCNP